MKPGERPTLEVDDDGAPFVPETDSLEALLRRATAATTAERRLREARKRLNSSRSNEIADRLLWEIHRLEEGRIWLTVARLAIFDTQLCTTCGSRHEFFRGWMYEQRHATDKTARRLTTELTSSAPPRLPERREDHHAQSVEACGNCIESQIAINLAASGPQPEAAK